MSKDAGEPPAGKPSPRKVAEFREHWSDEVEGAALYRSLAESAEGEQREIFAQLAAAEERHARHWAEKLVEAGEPEPSVAQHKLSAKARLLIWMTRRFGAKAMLPIVQRAEAKDAEMYDNVAEAKTGMALDERLHGLAVGAMVGRPSAGTVRAGIARGERWHRSDGSGALRAAVFGISDGLVSNTALVMGVTGGQVGAKAILFAGLAGLLAGAFSMGAGEYISVRSQRELYEREIRLEAEEIKEMPEEEAEELALIYRAKGVPKQEAEELARRISAEPGAALDTMAREELGLNPEELGSPWRVAISSFASFAIGAVVPVVSYVVGSGTAALLAAVLSAATALILVGAGVGLITGRSLVASGLRQLAVGGGAAVLTFAIGLLLHVAVG
ncbi:MAG: VIT1/CCC1 transporter family protein [Acidimicrobiales bacterium]